MGVAERFNKAKKDDGSQYLGTGIAFGVALGAGIGVAIQNIAIGVGCGLAIGLCIGSLMARKTKRASDKTRTHLPGPNS